MDDEIIDVHRLTGGACMKDPAPCPLTSCRYNLACGLSDWRLMHAKQPEPCSLRLAAGGPMTLEAVAQTLGVTRESVRQIEAKAVRRLGRALQRRGWQPWEVRAALEQLRGVA